MTEFKLAVRANVEDLVRISKAAFESDVQVGADGPGGPPEYDSLEWHYQVQNEEHLYVLLEDGTVIGGAILSGDQEEPGTVYVDRIFVAPQHHRKGYGIELMKQIEALYGERHTLKLDTPAWNMRTNAFYPKCGFHEVRREGEMIYFEKIL